MRTIGTLGATLAALLAGAPTIGAAPPPLAEREVPVGSVAAGTIDGTPARIAIAAGASGMPVLNADIAERAGLKQGMFAANFGIGPIRRRAPTSVAELTLDGGVAMKRRVAWTDGAVAGADGELGPAGLPEPVVRFVLRPARPGERITTMKLEGGGLVGGWLASLATMPLGKRELLVRFAPEQPYSFVSAGAGAVIAESHGGKVEPGADQVLVALGVTRPARRLVLARPFQVGPVALTRLKVRSVDFGNASGIPEAGAAEGDPDETVTVTGKAKKKNYRDRLTLAADALAPCSSITFDKPKREVRLSCR